MSLGTFTLIRNEAPFIAAHILRVLPYLDEMVFYDGASTDCTLEIIKAIKSGNAYGDRITLVEGKDPVNLREDYTRLFNECMWTLKTDLAYFLHPDMFVLNPEKLLHVAHSDELALSTRVRSFAGEPGGQLYEVEGRGQTWKNIYRLRGPDMGAHYFGHYGSHVEDVYFSEITGDSHVNHAPHFERYPYTIYDSGVDVMHFSDVRPYARRYGRMVECLKNQGRNPDDIQDIAAAHPRVTLKDGSGFKFVPAECPIEMIEANAAYAHLRKENDKTPCHA